MNARGYTDSSRLIVRWPTELFTLWYINLNLTIGPIPAITLFHVINAHTLYNLLVGRPWIHKHKLCPQAPLVPQRHLERQESSCQRFWLPTPQRQNSLLRDSFFDELVEEIETEVLAFKAVEIQGEEEITSEEKLSEKIKLVDGGIASVLWRSAMPYPSLRFGPQEYDCFEAANKVE